MKINPSLKEFLEQNKDITMVGVVWAFYWRFVAAMLAIYLAVYLVVAILTIAFE